MKNNIQSILLAILIILLCVGGFFIYGLYKDINDQLIEQGSSLQDFNFALVQMNNTVSRVGVQVASTKQLVDDMPETIKKMMDKGGQKPSGSSHIGGNVVGGKTVIDTIPKDNRINVQLSWPPNAQNQTLDIGQATFFIDKNQAVSETYPLDFNVDIFNSLDKNGNKYSYASLLAQGNSVDGKRQEYTIKINKMEVKEVKPNKPSWHTVPHIDGGAGLKVGAGLPQVGLSIGISPFSYGVTKDDNIFRVPRVGVGVNRDTLWLELQAGYNVGKNIPGLSDTWINAGPCIGIDATLGGCATVSSTW